MSNEKKQNMDRKGKEDTPVLTLAKKAKTFEDYSLNTNISVRNSLKWDINRCVRELLLNCTDEDPDTVVEQVNEYTWRLVNKVKAHSESLQKQHFSYHANGEKVEDRMKNGKFGYGLKDAVVMLTAQGIQYVARSIHGTFTAFADELGYIYVRISTSECILDGVEQILSIKCQSKLSAVDFKHEIELAQGQCISFRVRDAYKSFEPVEVLDENNKILGTVYLPPEETKFEGATEIFVHGSAYPFCEDGHRKPLALIYNLHMDKTNIKGRDRVGLPEKWDTALRNLIKDANDSVLSRLWTLQKTGNNFYEFNNQHCCNNINAYAKEIEEKERRIIDEAQRAERNVERALLEEKEAQEALQTALKANVAATEDSLPSVVVRRRDQALAELQKSASEAKAKTEAAQVCAAAKVDLARTATLSAAPTVLMFPYDKPCSLKVNPILIKSTKHADWVKGQVPTIEEFRLMVNCSPQIDRKYTRIFRQLRRLLYVLGLENTVIIKRLDFSVSASSLVVLRDKTMHVCFDTDEIAVVHAAILELCSTRLISSFLGRTPVDAVAQLSNFMLQLTPEEPQEIVKSRSDLYSQYLGQLGSSAAARLFCPLLIATEWDTKCGGISSFNIQLAKGLAAELRSRKINNDNTQPVVYVMVCSSDEIDEETCAQWNAAAEIGIRIIEASRHRGKYIPCLSVSQCSLITHIVGHAHVTGADAADLRNLPQLKHAKLWQINHVLPLDADILKEGGTSQSRRESAGKKEAILKALNEKADQVFSVGTMMYNHFEQQLDRVGRDSGTKHFKLILPLNQDFASQPTSKTDFNDVVQVLYFGRTESVYFLKGMDIAMRAVEKANANSQLCNSGKSIKLKVRGTKAGMEAETARKLIALQKDSSRDISAYVEGFASPAEVLTDLHKTHIVIMPSRNEPFGLVVLRYYLRHTTSRRCVCKLPRIIRTMDPPKHWKQISVRGVQQF